MKIECFSPFVPWVYGGSSIKLDNLSSLILESSMKLDNLSSLILNLSIKLVYLSSLILEIPLPCLPCLYDIYTTPYYPLLDATLVAR